MSDGKEQGGGGRLGQAPPTKRFFREASVAETPEGAFQLELDGRPTRTPGRQPLALPTRDLAEAIAAEWQAQGDAIRPATMPLTRLANSAIDGVAREVEAVRQDLLRYAGSDLVVYRAGEPARLVAEQSAAWDPVLDWAHRSLGARFMLSQGVMFVVQPETALARIGERLAAEASPFRLAALHVLTTLTGSVLLALMQAEGAIGPDEAWARAHVDELFQESVWGLDEEAAIRRANRRADFDAASRFLVLAAKGPGRQG